MFQENLADCDKQEEVEGRAEGRCREVGMQGRARDTTAVKVVMSWVVRQYVGRMSGLEKCLRGGQRGGRHPKG